jgi:hypothetical protein
MTETPPGYRPGVCDIGGRERRRRYQYAAICGLAAVAYAAAVLAWSGPTALLLGLFAPLSLGIEFLLQARRSFCASLGLRGRFDLRGGDGNESIAADGEVRPVALPDDPSGDGKVGRVTDPADRASDRRYALGLTALGVFGGTVGTLLACAAAVALG